MLCRWIYDFLTSIWLHLGLISHGILNTGRFSQSGRPALIIQHNICHITLSGSYFTIVARPRETSSTCSPINYLSVWPILLYARDSWHIMSIEISCMMKLRGMTILRSLRRRDTKYQVVKSLLGNNYTKITDRLRSVLKWRVFLPRRYLYFEVSIHWTIEE